MFVPDTDEERWMEDAKCSKDRDLFEWQKWNRNEDQFFDENAGSGMRDVAEMRVKRAREYCSGCPVREDCLAYALRHDEQGIWAGTTERQRNAMKKKARRAALLFLKLQQVPLPDDSIPNAS